MGDQRVRSLSWGSLIAWSIFRGSDERSNFGSAVITKKKSALNAVNKKTPRAKFARGAENSTLVPCLTFRPWPGD